MFSGTKILFFYFFKNVVASALKSCIISIWEKKILAPENMRKPSSNRAKFTNNCVLLYWTPPRAISIHIMTLFITKKHWFVMTYIRLKPTYDLFWTLKMRSLKSFPISKEALILKSMIKLSSNLHSQFCLGTIMLNLTTP